MSYRSLTRLTFVHAAGLLLSIHLISLHNRPLCTHVNNRPAGRLIWLASVVFLRCMGQLASHQVIVAHSRDHCMDGFQCWKLAGSEWILWLESDMRARPLLVSARSTRRVLPWEVNLATAAAAPSCRERIKWQQAHSDIRAGRPINTPSVRLTLRSPMSSCSLPRRDVTQLAVYNILLQSLKKKVLQQGSRRKIHCTGGQLVVCTIKGDAVKGRGEVL